MKSIVWAIRHTKEPAKNWMTSMEILYAFLAVLFVLYMRNRFRDAILQIKMEEAIKQSIKDAKQKRKIDELYGRDR